MILHFFKKKESWEIRTFVTFTVACQWPNYNFNIQHHLPYFKDIESNNKVSVEIRKKKKHDRWNQLQTNVLVVLWSENIDEIDPSQFNSTWKKIKLAVDKENPEKSLKQCKDKLRNLKDWYIRAEENNKVVFA